MTDNNEWSDSDIGRMLYELQLRNATGPTMATVYRDGRELTDEEKQRILDKFKEQNGLK